MSLLSEFKGNVNLSTDTGTSTTVGTTLKVNTVEAKAATDAIALYNNATSGTLTMGSALTSNLLLGSTSNTTQVQGTLVANALNPKSASANMTIASISTNATLTVGGNMTSSGGITLGSAACSTTVNGTLKATTINSTSASTDLTLASDQTGGRLILADATARTGNIFIANKQGASSGGTTDGGIYIATDARSNLASVNIGTASTSMTVKINNPLTFGWSAVPTSISQLGYITTTTQTSTSTISTTTTVGTITIAPAGCYVIGVNIQLELAVASTVPVNALIGVPNLASIGFSNVYASQYQNASANFVVNSNGSYSFPVVATCPLSDVSRISRYFINYNYTRIG